LDELTSTTTTSPAYAATSTCVTGAPTTSADPKYTAQPAVQDVLPDNPPGHLEIPSYHKPHEPKATSENKPTRTALQALGRQEHARAEQPYNGACPPAKASLWRAPWRM
jgi:hypothetical protein